MNKDYQIEQDALLAAKIYCSNLGEESVRKINSIIAQWKNDMLNGHITHFLCEERQRKIFEVLHRSKWAGDPVLLEIIVKEIIESQ
jgi:hypothetical protein